MNKIYLSVVIPVYNEESRIENCFKEIEEYFVTKDYSYEIIFVDDGSQDRTADIITERIMNKSNFRLIKNNINYGKGHGVKTGVMVASGEYIMFIDADMSTPINQLEKLLPFALKYNIVIGSRYLHSKCIKVRQPLIRRVVSRLGNIAMRIVLDLPFADTQCGFKLFQNIPAKEIFSRQTIERWGFDMEILAIAQKKKYSVKEVAVDWLDDSNSTLRAGHAAMNTLKELIKIKLNLIFNKYNE